MKLKFNNSVSTVRLTEAGNVAQGKRLIAIEKVYKDLEPKVEKAGYKFVKGSDPTRGFYLTLPKKFMYKFIFAVAEDESVKVTAQDFSGNSSEIPTELNVDTLANFDFAELLKELSPKLIPNINKPVSEALHENVTLLEYGPFDFIKNAINKHAAKKADKQAQKQADKNAKDLHNQALSHFAEAIKEVSKNFDAAVSAISLTPSSKVNKDSAEFIIMPKTSAYITVQLDINKEDVNTLKVAKVVGPDGKDQAVGNDISDVPTFIETLGKMLNINLQDTAETAEEAEEEATAGEKGDDSITSDEIEAEMDKIIGADDVMKPADFKDTYGSREFNELSDSDLRKILGTAFGKQSEPMLKSLSKESLVTMARELVK